MQKWLGIGLALVLLLGGGYYLYTSSKTSSPASTQTGSQKFSLKSLMGFTGSQTCTYQDTDGASSGTVYVSSGKMRADFATQVNAQATASHIVSDGSTMYMWMEGQMEGLTYTQADFEDLPDSSGTSTTTSKSVDLTEEVDYNCSVGSVDQSKFTPPADIKFTDYSQMMYSLGKGSGLSCSACDSLTGDAKTQCQTYLKCN